jgi:hypothetical protein
MEYLKKRNHFGNSVSERIILKWILDKVWRCGLHSYCSWQGSVAGCFEHCNKPDRTGNFWTNCASGSFSRWTLSSSISSFNQPLTERMRKQQNAPNLYKRQKFRTLMTSKYHVKSRLMIRGLFYKRRASDTEFICYSVRMLHPPPATELMTLVVCLYSWGFVGCNIVTWQLKGRNNGARRNCPLLGKGSVNTYRDSGYVRNSRGTVGSGDFYVVRPEAV